MKLTARLTLTFWLIGKSHLNIHCKRIVYLNIFFVNLASSTAFKISVPPKISSNQSLPIQFIENGVDFDEGFIFDPSFPDDISDIPSDTVSAISDDNEHHKFSESDKPSPISTLSRGRQKKSEDLPIDQENDDDYTDGFDGFDNTFLDDSNSDFPIYDENFSNFSDSYVTDTSLNTSHGVSGNFSPSFPTPRKNSNELIDESDDYEYEYYSEDEFGDEDFEYDFGENFDDEEGEQKEDFDPFKFDFPEETYEQKNIIKKFAAWLNAQWNGFVDNVRSTNTRNQFEFTNLTDIKGDFI